MSVIIRGMEPPKPKLTDTVYRAYVLVRPNGHAEIVVDDEDGLDSTAYPLVPVPPHGRLIDESKISLAEYEQAARDALHNGKGSSLYDCGVLAGIWSITQLVRRAPTIIEAEEADG